MLSTILNILKTEKEPLYMGEIVNLAQDHGYGRKRVETAIILLCMDNQIIRQTSFKQDRFYKR